MWSAFRKPNTAIVGANTFASQNSEEGRVIYSKPLVLKVYSKAKTFLFICYSAEL